MRFGINILNFGRHTDPTTLLGWARFTEDTGFHFALTSDHIALTPDVAEQYPAPFYEPFTLLGWLAGLTSRIELGTTVTILPYRHPLETARVAACVDRFSGGRLILGVGVGWAKREYAALNVPFERRGAMTTEYLDVIRRSWTEDVLSYRGRFVSFGGVATAPRPAREPHPPIWVGGNSPAAIRRAVRFGDAWHPINAPLEWLRDEGLPALREAARVAGRPVPAFAPRTRLRLTDAPLDDRLPGQGTLEQVIGDIEAFAGLGATHLLLDTYEGTPDRLHPPAEDQEMLAAVAAEVISEN
jgi:probable F420-dependent oxidoreductase